MFGIRFIQFQPNEYVMRYKKGKLIREGNGLSFYFYAPNTSLVVVPLGTKEVPFIFEETTADFQTVTLQGEVAYRIVDKMKVAELMNYSYDFKRQTHLSDDPAKLSQRIVNIVRVLAKKEIDQLTLKDAVKSSEKLATSLAEQIKNRPEILQYGVEVISLSVLAILPNKETARALEAESREVILLKADEAIYQRRNAAIEQERILKENELSTEIAIEEKKKQIKEAQLESEKMVQIKRNSLKKEQLDFEISQEDKKKDLVLSEVENAKLKADAKAYEITKSMEALQTVDNDTLKALANMGMDPSQMIAFAFQEIAGNANKIGELNISPDLLKSLMKE